MFIMETGPAEKFVVQVREIKNVDGEDLDIFLIWIAFHGNVGQAPDWRFRGRLCFNLSPDHDGVERSMVGRCMHITIYYWVHGMPLG